MNQPTITKQIAKEITILRYIPDHQLYQLEVQWHNRHDSIVYLPEIFVHPYANQPHLNTQSTKISEFSFTHEINLADGTSFMTSSEEEKIILAPQIEQLPPLKPKAILDYDARVLLADLQDSYLVRNREVWRQRETREGRKKKNA